jgi:protocatechuate 3,4-dioxygenase beta subunit
MRTLTILTVLLLALLTISACAPVPAATVPAPTAAPAATEAPGSTEAAPTPDPNATPIPAMPPARDEPRPTETLDPTVTQPATTEPLPTMPPAPTAASAAIDCIPGALTPAQTEGPYYTANPPETNSLFKPGMAGTKILLTGYVLDEQCRPIALARVDFWQADAAGQYDNQGYTLRGYTLTDAEGRYAMETVIPGEYPGRTPHIHVKVTPPGGATLTSQLYLPDAVANATDRIFSPELVVKLSEGPDGLVGTFDFVVDP